MRVSTNQFPHGPWMAPMPRFVLRVVLATALGLVLLVAARTALATCATATDCDGDGIPNHRDACPSNPDEFEQAISLDFNANLSSKAYTPPQGGTLRGFRDAACFHDFVPPVQSPCQPVAVRVYSEKVSLDPLKPSAKQERVGFVWVGAYYDSDAGGPNGLDVAHWQLVRSTFASGFAGADLPANSLFACMGAVEFDVSAAPGAVKRTDPPIYGFRLATSYVRAIVEASGKTSNPNFSDALGLIRESTDNGVREPSSTLIHYRSGLAGTNGTLHDDSRFGLNAKLLDAPYEADDLPIQPTYGIDRECYEEYLRSLIVQVQTVPERFRRWIDPRISRPIGGGDPEPLGPGDVELGTFFTAVRGPFGLPAITQQGLAPSPKWEPPLNANIYGELGQLPAAPRGVLDQCRSTLRKPFPLVFVDGKRPFLEKDEALFDKKAGKLDGWKDFFQGVDEPRALHRAVDEFAKRVGGDTYLEGGLRRGAPSASLLEERPEIVPPYLIVRSRASGLPGAVYKERSLLQTPPPGQFASQEPDWIVVTGASYSALQAANASASPIRALTTSEGNSLTTVSIDLAGPYLSHQSTQNGYVTVSTFGADVIDHIDVSVPKGEFARSFDFAKDGDRAFFNAHFTASTWHPGGDRWLTNAPGSACSLSSLPGLAIKANPSNAVAGAWCSDQMPPSSTLGLGSYEERVKLCKEGYDPADASAHWRVVQDQVPFAALYGILPLPGKSSGDDGEPFANFPSGDLVTGGVQGTFTNVHLGMDINWKFRNKKFIQPEYQGVLGTPPNEYCSASHVWTYDIQVPLSCSDPIYEVCGSLAGPAEPEDERNGCNPIERIWEQYKKDIAEACSISCGGCDDWDIFCHVLTPFECVADALYTAVDCPTTVIVGFASVAVQTVHAYVHAAVCSILTGGADNGVCGDDAYRVFRTPYPRQEIEHELEYGVAFGANSPAQVTPGLDECGGLKCTSDSWVQGLPNCWSFSPPHSGVCVNSNLGADVDPNGGNGFPFGIWPFTFAPGIFNPPAGIWGGVSKKFGHSSGLAATSILPEEIRRRPTDLQEGFFAGENVGFRIQFVGDLIVDCGHNPLKTELHPPTAIQLNASTKGMVQKRYSIFGWHRQDFARAPIVFDLWPGPRRSAAMRPSGTDLYPKSGGIFFSGSAPKGKIACSEFPPEAPSRFRCVLDPSSDTTDGRCGDAPRLRPDCATDVAGGLVEVDWR